jgi:hypothetical protein
MNGSTVTHKARKTTSLRRFGCVFAVALIVLPIPVYKAVRELSERHKLGLLSLTVAAIRKRSTPVGPFPIQGAGAHTVAGGKAYILRTGADGLEVLFPTDIQRQDAVFPDNLNVKYIQVCGYIYSDRVLPDDLWIDFSGAIPGAKPVSTWTKSRRFGHWYWVEPFISD